MYFADQSGYFTDEYSQNLHWTNDCYQFKWSCLCKLHHTFIIYIISNFKDSTIKIKNSSVIIKDFEQLTIIFSNFIFKFIWWVWHYFFIWKKFIFIFSIVFTVILAVVNVCARHFKLYKVTIMNALWVFAVADNQLEDLVRSRFIIHLVNLITIVNIIAAVTISIWNKRLYFQGFFSI